MEVEGELVGRGAPQEPHGAGDAHSVTFVTGEPRRKSNKGAIVL